LNDICHEDILPQFYFEHLWEEAYNFPYTHC
jgi:hypothetical protein